MESGKSLFRGGGFAVMSECSIYLFRLGKSREKTLLQKSVVSDRLQRLLQPKLLK